MTVSLTKPDAQKRMAQRIALQRVKALRQHRAAYEAEVREWYTSGDGRSPKWRTEPDGRIWNAGGRGYAFPTCIHGRSLWVDHDIPCGACEDGPDNLYEVAWYTTVRDVAEYLRRTRAVTQARDAGVPVDPNAYDWALVPLENW